ncbi:MAG: hypothetical protein JWO47_161 [Candidatus Saccharibacteria bacterium]|nr:hypothetical protein [Candidatus Saccharibacteria bacterium]
MVHTSPSNIAIGDKDPSFYIRQRYVFDHVVGLETGLARARSGRTGHGQTPLRFPRLWAERLETFFNEDLRPAKGPHTHVFAGTNCHGFANYMTTGIKYNANFPKFKPAPELAVGDDTPAGTHIGLIGKRHGLMHSAILLGEQAPGKCIEVTGPEGVLAIDSLAAILEDYQKDFGDVRGWFTAPAAGLRV